MDAELALVLGVVICGFAVPAILSSISEGRPPRASAFTILIGGGLLLYAISVQPGGFQFSDIPNAFVSVIARYMP